MNKIFFYSILCCSLSACVYDPSTVVVDDNGVTHHTKHYSVDYRGRMHFPMQVKPIGRKQFIFDPQATAWAAYDVDGHRVMTGSGSGGLDYCNDVGQSCRTVTGSFYVYRKKDANCRSGEYPVEQGGGAKMPYCMYFYRGYTIHAAYDVPTYNSSHGCIRVLPSAAKWLNEEFITIGTKVTVLPYKDPEN